MLTFSGGLPGQALGRAQLNPIMRKENRNLKIRLSKKLYDENVWHLNISKPSVIQFFVSLTSMFIFILVKFYCFARSFVPNIEAKSVILELTTRDSECWFLLTGSSLVHVMVSLLPSDKPLSEPMMTYYQPDPQQQTSVKFEWNSKTFLSRKCM